MALIIFGDSFTFPDGNASTNRVYTYARGFIENNEKVHVICFENEYVKNFNGVKDEIPYYHPLAQAERSTSFIKRRWVKFKKFINAFILVRNINRQEGVTAINLWTYRSSTQIFAFILAKSTGSQLILDRSEHPLRMYRDNTFGMQLANLKLKFEIRLYDAIFCISNYLIEFYGSRGFRKERLFLVPSTVDTGRFNFKYPRLLPYEYILYCGSLTLLKDGVNILVKSFAKIADKHKDINLVLIGKGDTPDEEASIRELVNQLNLENRIIFLGQRPRTEVPGYLINAKILALARPKSKIADAGFPSKLTEYLTTGNPVVVTRVGEIPDYLTNNESAFLAEPDSVDAFAEKLNYALDNYRFALDVGAAGKKLTDTVFNYNYQAKRMLSFLNSF